jgi:hypothetical protein
MFLRPDAADFGITAEISAVSFILQGTMMAADSQYTGEPVWSKKNGESMLCFGKPVASDLLKSRKEDKPK